MGPVTRQVCVNVPAVVVLNWTSAQNGALAGSGVTGLAVVAGAAGVVVVA